MYKSVIMWFLSPIRIYKTDKRIDAFIYMMIDAIKRGDATISATARQYHVLFEGVQYNLWASNKFYAYLSDGGYGDILGVSCWNNLWKEKMPSRKCCFDFYMMTRRIKLINPKEEEKETSYCNLP